jgi:hypothetical protein
MRRGETNVVAGPALINMQRQARNRQGMALG